MKNIQSVIDLLGRTAKDKVTGFNGVITSVSFDLYGCTQAIVSPPVRDDQTKPDAHWLDVNRLEISRAGRVMPLPSFEDKGPAAKPIQRSV